MKKILLNYADYSFRDAQKLNSKTGLEIGGFDEVRSYGPKDIDEEFFTKNKKILQERRGNGYWLWKPYFLLKTLNEVEEGDFVFYCDAGAQFIDSIDPLFGISLTNEEDILVFGLPYLEKEWTKRDAFILMECDEEGYTDSPQRLGTFILCRKSKMSLKFVVDWLVYAEDERIVTNLENQMGKENYDGFQEHRHDQSIVSLLSKKYNLAVYRDPSQWGNENIDKYNNSMYPQLIDSTRMRNFSTRVVHKIKRVLGLSVYEKVSIEALFKRRL